MLKKIKLKKEKNFLKRLKKAHFLPIFDLKTKNPYKTTHFP